jgi:hypothetical protein
MSDQRVLLDAARFMDSAQAASLAVEAGAARTIVQRFLTACYGDLGMAPRLLDGGHLAELLQEALPRQFGARDPLADDTEAVLAAYLEFLTDHEVVPASFEQRRALAEHIGAFTAAVAAGAAHRDGLVAKAAATVRHRAERTGRNDPCPCGSGRKFKKCCMALGQG